MHLHPLSHPTGKTSHFTGRFTFSTGKPAILLSSVDVHVDTAYAQYSRSPVFIMLNRETWNSRTILITKNPARLLDFSL